MKYAIIENGKVVNVAVSDTALAANWIPSETAKIGDLYDDGAFTTPEPDTVIPDVVTMRQARLALLEAGKLSDIDTAIASLSSPAKEAVQIEWEYSQTVDRSHTWVQQLGTALSLDLDQLFLSASQK